MKKEKSKMFLLTIINPEYKADDLNYYLQSLPDFKYACWQIEQDSVGKHIQLFLKFKKYREVSEIQNMFPKAHVEYVRSSSDKQCVAYCSKEPRVDGPYFLNKKHKA